MFSGSIMSTNRSLFAIERVIYGLMQGLSWHLCLGVYGIA